MPDNKKNLFDADGNPVENVYTEEEIERRLNEAKTEAEREKEEAVELAKKEVQEDIKNKEEDLQRKEKELQDALNSSDDEKTKNLAALRRKAEEAQREVERVKKEAQENVQEILKKADERRIEETIKSIVGENEGMREEMKKKIDFLSKSQGGIPENSQELRKMASDAYTLIKGVRPESQVNFDAVSSAGAGPSQPPSQGKISEKGKEAAKEFGLSDEDIEKYESGELGKKQ